MNNQTTKKIEPPVYDGVLFKKIHPWYQRAFTFFPRVFMFRMEESVQVPIPPATSPSLRLPHRKVPHPLPLRPYPPTSKTIYPHPFPPHLAYFQKPPDDNRVAPPTCGHGIYPPPTWIETPSAIA